jgi:hypothetical protein
LFRVFYEVDDFAFDMEMHYFCCEIQNR